MSIFSDNSLDKELVKAVSEVMSKGMAYATGTKKAMELTGDEPPLEKPTIKKAHKIARAILRQESNEPSKANGGIAHMCATHVKHATYGEGRCIPGMHTIEENELGEGTVTHYDVMFTKDTGPYIVENVSVEELEILAEKRHKHPEMKEEKGDMDKDGVHEPDDKEYMDNKDKAIKAAMAAKKKKK